MKVIRVGLLFLLAFSVFAFGAVEVWSESLLEVGAALLLISWAVLVYKDKHATIPWSPLNWPLLGVYRRRYGSTGFSLDTQSIPHACGIAETRRIFHCRLS